ncbi:MAG TPA: AraC family transcriptional regulator [Rhizomicrobium sp.]|jgi:AraC-like DNA-binding protein|nr:AraC family transcriptional regulator [Rhizomicrobium sp.]
MTPLADIDMMLRGAAAMLPLLLGALLLRDYPKLTAARLGALFALGVAAYAICSAPGFHAWLGPWALPVMALATGNNLVFWLFARALFDDGFKPQWWHGALWCGIVALAMFNAGPVVALQAILFALLACVQTAASWSADLVESRRRIRPFVVGAAAVHTIATALNGLATNGQSSPWGGIASTAGLLLVSGVVAWSLLRVSAGEMFPVAKAAEPDVAPADPALVAALGRLMATERLWRREGLTIGALAQIMALPEYKLRRLINGGLGYRNFNAFLNRYRIGEAKAALADPVQAEVPVLTIAMDAGFSSLGPFNRAFKAETGQTPTEFRRAALERPVAAARAKAVAAHELG